MKVNAHLEETLIYPAIRQQIDADDMINEALEEHHLVQVLIKELKKLKLSSDTFQAKFKVLADLVTHHVQEEEGEILPKAEQHDIDWDVLDASVRKRKAATGNQLATGIPVPGPRLKPDASSSESMEVQSCYSGYGGNRSRPGGPPASGKTPASIV